MLRRSSLARKTPERQPRRDRSDEFVSYTTERPRARMAALLGGEIPNPITKDDPVRSRAYREAVASLPCIRCGIPGFSQCAHEDQGKGGALKSDDRRSYPACGPRPGEPGCHYLIGTARIYPKAQRRALEAGWVKQTQAELVRLGRWPKSVPRP